MKGRSKASSTVSPVVGATADEVSAGAQLANRVRAETEQLREVEYQAVLRELAVKDAYVHEVEREITRSEEGARATRDELAEVRARAAELFADLEKAEAVIAALNVEIARLQGEIASIKGTRSYRFTVAATTFLHRLPSPARRSGPMSPPSGGS